MKISKLFHWLYALVMLLPVFAIGVTCGYAMFNKNAYLSWGDNSFLESTIEVNNLSLCEENDILTFNYINAEITTSNQTSQLKYKTISFNPTDYGFTQDTYDSFSIDNRTNAKYIFFYDGLGNYEFKNIWGTQLTSFSITTYNNTNGNTISQTNNCYKSVYEVAKIDNVFYYSVEKVMNESMFSWAYDSFLASPIVYITSLFSIPSTHIVVELLSYWLAISIIWLVFDLVMYVPLLVHRWIDKGVLE